MTHSNQPDLKPRPSIADALRAAEPTAPKHLSGLVDRLRSLGEVVDLVWPEAEPETGPDDRPEAAATMVRGVSSDSRTVTQGTLFVAIPGSRADGHRFGADAQRAGAAAMVVERAIPGSAIPQIVVARARPILAEAAAWWYGDPSRELGVVGITGTDGKTTTSFLAAAGLTSAGLATGLLGTVANQIGGVRESNPAHSTTPESPTLQRALRAMVQAGDEAAIIETTSHGLSMDRVRAIAYDIAIFTNLTHEHLELHGTFEAYRAAKRLLFEGLARPVGGIKGGRRWPRTGIVNADDPAASTFATATIRAGARLIAFGAADNAEVRLLEVTDEPDGLRVDYDLKGKHRAVRLHLAGRFNAHNALAVAALGMALDLDPDAVEAGMAELGGVPGRMERVELGQPFRVVIDYAHSPASLALVLDELGAVASAAGGGVISVFGSAGDRDREKRPLMGAIAAERSRIVILTDEDPRTEERTAILADIAAGATGSGHRPEAILQIADRTAAIREAMRRAREGDVVLLAGKGHEATIEYADHDQSWNERAEVEAALAQLGWRT